MSCNSLLPSLDPSSFPAEGEESSIHYDDDAIEALLDRSQEEEGEVGPGENLLANEYLSSFKVGGWVTHLAL